MTMLPAASSFIGASITEAQFKTAISDLRAYLYELLGDDGSVPLYYVPTGTVAHFAMSAAPTGWLKANGAAVSRTTYAALFAAIGTTFGVGDGSTTFNLPDLRGEFLRGLDDGRGVDSGRGLGTAQSDDYKAHTHAINNTVSNNTGGGVGNNINPGGTGPAWTSGSSGGTETRPRNIALLVCIKT